MPDEERPVSVVVAAAHYGVTRATIERWIKRDLIAYERRGRTLRVWLSSPPPDPARAPTTAPVAVRKKR